MKKSLLVILVSVVSFGSIKANTQFLQPKVAYKLKLRNEVLLIGSGVLTSAYGLWQNSRLQPLSLTELTALNPGAVNNFDSHVLGNWSTRSHIFSDAGLVSSFVLASGAALYYTFNSKRKLGRFITFAIIGVEANLLLLGVTESFKNTVKRNRPYMYNENVPLEERLSAEGRRSFFSGHMAFTTCNAFLMNAFIQDYSQNQYLKIASSITSVALPAFVGFHRINGGKHFYTDVIAGFVVGGIAGVSMPTIHKKKSLKERLTVAPTFGKNMSSLHLVYSF
ncbi:MAG: phosphatase PAP2 family protein [Bacteroidetes bacterium]|nr:phosphatase PAP2 family protein [Bacteroidota bacterium]